jgi:ABC-2 type transport system permease protein
LSIKRHAGIFRECLRIAVATATAYRANFIMTMTIVFFSNILFPLVTILIYGAGASFPGWTFWEVLLIQGIFTVSSGISGVFFNGVFWQTNFKIREGTYEVILLKPVDALFWLVVSSIQPEEIGMAVGGIVMVILSLVHIGGVALLGILAGILFFFGGVCVMFGITLVMAATSFKWVGNSRIPEIFSSILNFAKYPQNIFPQTVKGIVTFILPVSMIGFFPASALIGKIEPFHFLALIPCVIFMITGILLYKSMIHLYEGVGG